MGKKRDLYIKYERSNKRHSRKNGQKIRNITLAIIIITGIGLAAYFTMNQKTALDNLLVASEPTSQPTVQPTSQPTAQPVQEVGNDSVQENSSVVDSSNPDAIKGIYVPAKLAGTQKVDDLIELAKTTEINAMVIDVKDDCGRISYDMESPMAKEIGAVTNTIPDMEALVKKLKEKKIYLIARVVAFKDPFLASKRTDLAIMNKNGTQYLDSNGQGWVNPYNKKVWGYLVEVSSQAAAIGFDEIQFDYIRFSTSKEIAQADFGGDSDTKSKEDIITEFTKYAYTKLKPLGVNVSADVYGTIIASSIDSQHVGQNFVEMSKYLDYICPMIYPSHFSEGNFGVQYPDMEPFEIISKVLAISATKLNGLPKEEHHAIVRPWLQDFTATWIEHHQQYGGEELREQIDGVYSVGYGEWLLWNSGCDYSKSGLLEE